MSRPYPKDVEVPDRIVRKQKENSEATPLERRLVCDDLFPGRDSGSFFSVPSTVPIS